MELWKKNLLTNYAELLEDLIFFFVYSLVHLEHWGCSGSLSEKYGNPIAMLAYSPNCCQNRL